MDFAKTRQVLDLKLLCFLVLISLVFVFNFHDANATTTIIKNYASGGGTLYCTTGSAGGGSSNNVCYEEYSGLPAGHRITTGGFDGSLIYNGQQIREYLYKDDGVILHTPKLTLSGTNQVNFGPVTVAEKYSGLPAGHLITSFSLTVGVAGNNGCFTFNPSSYQVALYAGTGGNNIGSLLYGSTTLTTPCNAAVETFAPFIKIPSSGIVWEVISMSNGCCNQGGVMYSDAVGGNITSVTGSHVCCNAWEQNFGTTTTGTFAPLMTMLYNDYNITGYPKTKFDTSPITSMNQGVNTVTFPNNATVPTSGNVWLGIFGQHASDNSNVYGAMPSNSTGIPAGQVVTFNNGDNGLPFTFAFDATQLFNSTIAPYSSLTYSNANLILSPTSGNVGSTVTATGDHFTANSLNTITDGGTNSGQVSNYGAVSVEKFNIGANQGMQSLQLFAQDTGAGNHTRTYNGAVSRQNLQNNLYLIWLTGFTPNATINKVTITTASSAGQLIDVGIYKADGPPTSLGEAGPSTIISSSGVTALTGGNPSAQNFTVNAKVPSNGNIWLGVMTNQTFDIYYNAGGTRNCGVGVSFPNFPTNPTCNDGTGFTYKASLYYDNHNSGIIIKGYDNSGVGGNPNIELFESPKQLIQSGFHNYTINSATTASGIVYLGYEVNNTDALFGDSTNLNPASSCGVNHVFGTGPNPFGTTTCGIGAATTYEKVYYDTTFNKITLKFDGNTLTTIPSSIFTTDTGTFSGIFSVPNSIGGPHTVNASDANDWSTAQFSTNAQYTVSLKPLLHDGFTPITSGKLIVTQNGVTIGTSNTNNTGWTSVSGLSGGNYNFTIMDDKNFAVYKEINTNVASNIAKNVATNDYPFDCVSPFSGYQADFIIRINDTDGHHITNVSTPTCPNQNQLKFSVTFTANGQTSTSYSSSMITTAGTQVYAANPSSFTVNNATVPTTFTQGNNIISNPFSIGSGLTTFTKNFVMNLTATQSTNAGAGSSGQNYFTTNSTCFAGVFDPKTNTCVFGLVNITAPPVIITVNPNTQQTGGVEVDCSGNGYITITSANLGSNPLGIALGQLPINIQCGQTTPTTCPTGTTLTNGVCVAPLTCPVGSQTQNGICTAPLTCPTGTTLQNAQCIAPTTCADGSQPMNGQCNNIVPITLPPTPSPCDITNPLSCITSTTQSQDVVVTGVTPDGKPISVTTTVTKVLNPELNNVSLVIILLIIAAIIAGIIYRYLTRKKKPKGRKVKNYSGNGNKIDRFNKKVKNEV